jgi:protocatechuate 3,4-dioxygenase beta subunit
MSSVHAPQSDDIVDFNEGTALDLILATVKDTPSPRNRALFESLLRHLIGFVLEARPTPQEWRTGLEFLKRTGQMSTAMRDEFGLIDALLGTEMLIDIINRQRPEQATPNSVLGPFFNPNAPRHPYLADITGGVPGERVVVHGEIKSLDGKPVAGADVDIWQTDEDGFYDAQMPGEFKVNLRGKFTTDERGRYACILVRAHHYDVPTDGTGGEMLRAMGRKAGRPAHIHMMVEANGYDTVITSIFPAGDPLIGNDAGFGVRKRLIAPYQQATAEDASRFSLPLPFLTMKFDYALVKATPR